MSDETNRLVSARQVQEHQLLYPDERVVAFLAANYPDVDGNFARRALDFGFGSGRHVRLLLDYGFQAFGIDYAQEAVEVARSLLKDHSHLQDLRVADLNEKPYPDNFFDVVISWGVSFLRPVEEMLRDLRIMNALMKNGSRMIVNFRTKDNWFYGKGRAVKPDTFLLDHSAGPYSMMCYTFLALEQADELLCKAGFKVDGSERIDLWKNNRSEHHSWWIFWARKGDG